MIKLTEQLESSIVSHATKMFPRECCGLLIAHGSRPRFLPCSNQSVNVDHFVISAEDYARAEEAGPILAVVHSHVNLPARPSEADLVACEATGVPWIVVAMHQDGDSGQPYAAEWSQCSPSGYLAPLVGRHFHFGSLDCYGLVRDFYSRELGTDLPDFVRVDRFWERGEDLYMQNFQSVGFRIVKNGPLYGDVILMQYRSPVVNHGGVFLGDAVLKDAPELLPIHDAMLHHVSPRLSERVVYGGHWAEITRVIVRHKSRL